MSAPSIKVLIVDDEPFARKYIGEMLRGETDIEVIGEAGNGKAAARLIAKNRPDLMFLDIQMPEMDGFGLLQTLDQNDLPVIVFTTAYEEYAIRAFEVHALDYLLKPFDQARFGQALERARGSLLERGSRSQELEQIAQLLETIQHPPKYLERLLVKQSGRIVFVKIAQVDWIKADDKYVHLHGQNSRHMIRQTLAAMKAQLDPAKFVQVNRSVIVNIDSIKELHPGFHGEHEVQLHDGAKFTLSKNHKDELFDRLGKPFS
jgi:two-component system LytT family response regulator